MLALRRSEAGKREIKPAGPVMRFFKREKVAGWLFVAPWVIGFLAFNLYPLLATIYNSFTKLGLFGQAQWIGLKNYQQLFTQDAIFAKAISNMLIYVLSTTAIYIVGGLVLALLLHKKFPGNHFFRVIFYIPSLMVGVGVGSMMVQVFNGQNYGLFNEALGLFRIPPVEWLSNYDHPWMGLVAMIITTFWFVGGAMLIFIAGLKGISKTYYEAARIDGANAWHSFWSVTLPLLTPVLLFNTVMTLISNIQAFALPLIFAGGGSGSIGAVASVLGYHDSLSMFLTYLYQEGFINHKYGYASAIAMVIFVITLVMTAIVLAVFRRFTFYQGNNAE